MPTRRRTARRRFTVLVALGLGLHLAGTPVTAGSSDHPLRPAPAPRAEAAYPSTCRNASDPIDRATDLMANRYRFSPHPVVELPADPTWRENPLRDANWLFQYHSLRFVLDLFVAWNRTGDTAYRDRGLFLLRDWYESNPRSSPPSPYSWNDHSTAFRAIVYACAADLTPMTTWLRAALELHGRTLADPGFYVRVGNHALNQALGLLEVGRALGRGDWMRLARDRMNALVATSVDAQGVTNEQAVFYQDYTYRRDRLARDRIRAVGLLPGAAFARIDLMPRFLAHATLPNGEYEMLGDTHADAADVIRGTAAEYPATQGASGYRPSATVVSYGAGYQFLRSGWGDARAYTDETFSSARWGPGTRYHGHPDGLSMTLYAYGARLLVDPGAYSYNSDAWRRFFTSRQAHNVVTVDGLTWNRAASTTLLSRTVGARAVDIRLRASGYAGVTHVRRITYVRPLDVFLVEDRLTSSTTRTFRQLWHLAEDADPWVGVSTVITQRERGNVLIRQLGPRPVIRVVAGRTSPIQGWIAYEYGQRVPAPVVETVRSGRSARYLTLIAPAEGRPDVQARELRLTADGYSVLLTAAGRSARVTTRADAVWVSSGG